MQQQARYALAKVPEITALFWIIKVLTTGMGEAASDFLVTHLDPAIAVGLGAIAFIAALALQFAVRRYMPWIYWLAVAMVAVFGTMIADGRNYLTTAWWISAFPGLVLTSTVLSIYFLGDGLRDVLDPRLRL